MLKLELIVFHVRQVFLPFALKLNSNCQTQKGEKKKKKTTAAYDKKITFDFSVSHKEDIMFQWNMQSGPPGIIYD